MHHFKFSTVTDRESSGYNVTLQLLNPGGPKDVNHHTGLGITPADALNVVAIHKYAPDETLSVAIAAEAVQTGHEGYAPRNDCAEFVVQDVLQQYPGRRQDNHDDQKRT